MCNRHRWLQQQQALFGIRKVDTRNPLALYFGREDLIRATLDNPFVVVGGVECVGRQLESALAFHTSMAGGVVAALLCQDAGYLASEADRVNGLRLLDLQR